MGTVFVRNRTVTGDRDGVVAELARNDCLIQLEAMKNVAVKSSNPFDAERHVVFLIHLPLDVVDGRDDVLDFLLQILLRGGEPQLALKVSQNLLFSQGVPLDGGGG